MPDHAWPHLATWATGSHIPWEPFRNGVDIHRLATAPTGCAAALLRYAPGAAVPRHRHTGAEHLLILSGHQVDHRGEYRAGTLVINPTGSEHTVASPEGCIVLAIWEQPVEFLDDG